MDAFFVLPIFIMLVLFGFCIYQLRESK